MSAEWIEVQIKSSLDSGELLALLGDSEVQGAWQDADTIHVYWPVEHWSPDQFQRIQEAFRRLPDFREPEPEMLVQRVEQEDWNRKWAQSVKPLYVGKRIVVRPSWETVDVKPGEIEIVLDPKQAFGTGHHATTRMLLEWLEASVRGGESVLDVGTGSGLLAMVALRLGAASAIGIDNDPVAIECAIDCAFINRFGKELQLQCGTLRQGQSYDLVLANLDRQTLLVLADDLAAVTKSRLILSGLLLEQRQEIVAAFARRDLYPINEREAEGWLALEFGPSQSCEGV